MASYYCLDANLQWWDEPLYPGRRDVLKEICKLINSDSSFTYGSGWGKLEEAGEWEVLGAGEIGFPMAERYEGVVKDIEEALPLKFSLPFASGTLEKGKAIMQANRRRADADMLPSGWTLAGTLDVAIPDEMEAAWGYEEGGDPTREELIGKPLAFYFQAAAGKDLGNMAGCHFTDELERALEDYYGIDRFTLYQGTSQCAFSSPAYTWHLTAYTDEFGDMWLALTPFRTARRRVRADADMLPQDWIFAGRLHIGIPEEMDLAWGGDATDEEITSRPLAFYFQAAADRYLVSHGGCHFTDKMEKALEDYYGIDRNAIYMGSAGTLAALSAPAYTWSVTAYTDRFGDMWLALASEE